MFWRKKLTPPKPETPIVSEPSVLERLTQGLSKSADKISTGLSDLFTKRKLDASTLSDLEDLLIMADLGPQTAAKITARFAEQKLDKDATDLEIRQALAHIVAEILRPCEHAINFGYSGLETWLVTGVNGVGKTTTIGKVTAQAKQQGKNVILAAADTFRAAAIEQLKIWGTRSDVPVIAKDQGADPAAVAFEALETAQKNGNNLLIVDTAGRLHNKAQLMEELSKIIRVLKKLDSNAPQQVLLVLDATTGQNALEQVRVFKDVVGITGLIITKLDGSAKGGVVVALADQMQLPILAIGVGEQIADLQPFVAEKFAYALLGLSD